MSHSLPNFTLKELLFFARMGNINDKNTYFTVDKVCLPAGVNLMLFKASLKMSKIQYNLRNTELSVLLFIYFLLKVLWKGHTNWVFWTPAITVIQFYFWVILKAFLVFFYLRFTDVGLEGP